MVSNEAFYGSKMGQKGLLAFVTMDRQGLPLLVLVCQCRTDWTVV